MQAGPSRPGSQSTSGSQPLQVSWLRRTEYVTAKDSASRVQLITKFALVSLSLGICLNWYWLAIEKKTKLRLTFRGRRKFGMLRPPFLLHTMVSIYQPFNIQHIPNVELWRHMRFFLTQKHLLLHAMCSVSPNDLGKDQWTRRILALIVPFYDPSLPMTETTSLLIIYQETMNKLKN